MFRLLVLNSGINRRVCGPRYGTYGLSESQLYGLLQSQPIKRHGILTAVTKIKPGIMIEQHFLGLQQWQITADLALLVCWHYSSLWGATPRRVAQRCCAPPFSLDIRKNCLIATAKWPFLNKIGIFKTKSNLASNVTFKMAAMTSFFFVTWSHNYPGKRND